MPDEIEVPQQQQEAVMSELEVQQTTASTAVLTLASVTPSVMVRVVQAGVLK
jgi:hypothetical protein